MIDAKKLLELAESSENANQLARALKSVLAELARVTAERGALRTESESLASNLRGKYSTAGATYAHLIAERDALKAERVVWQSATLAERERCAMMFERMDEADWSPTQCAEAIRKGL